MALSSFLALGASCLSWQMSCHIKPSANGLLTALGVVCVGRGSKGGGEPRRNVEEGVDSGELSNEDPGESETELPDSGVASRTRVLRSKGPEAEAACKSR